MANRIQFTIVAKTVTTELDRLQKELGDLAGAVGKVPALGKDIIPSSAGKNVKELKKEIKGLESAIEGATGKNLGRINMHSSFTKNLRLANTLLSDMSEGFIRGEKHAGSLEQQVRNLGRGITKLDSLGDKMRILGEREVKEMRELEQATKRYQTALEKVKTLGESGVIDERAMTRANQELKESERDVKRVSMSVNKLKDEWNSVGQEVVQHQQKLRNLRNLEVEDPDAFNDRTIKQIEVYADALQSVQEELRKYGHASADSVTKMRNQATAVESLTQPVNEFAADLKDLQAEQTRWANNLIKNVGSTRSAMNSAATAITRQEANMAGLASTSLRYSGALERLQEIDQLTASVMGRGNTELKERKALITSLSTLKGDVASAEKSLYTQSRRLDEDYVKLSAKLDEAKEKFEELRKARDAFAQGSVKYNDLTDDLDRQTRAIQKYQDAMKQNRESKLFATGEIQKTTNLLRQITERIDGIRSSFTRLDSVRGVWGGMTKGISEVIRLGVELASTYGKKVTNAINVAAGAMRKISGTAGSVFAGLSKALNSTGGAFSRFGNHVKNSMEEAKSSMLAVTATGYALMSIGNQIQMFGNMSFRRMTTGMGEYMEYERMRIQAAIAATSMTPDGQMNVDHALLDNIIFDMQRGTGGYLPQSFMDANNGQPLPVTFNAKDLAQGMYYYSAAIGQEITETNAKDFIPTINTIMQMAKVSNTPLESAIKGIMNIAMEFGYDPRAADQQGDIQDITAKVGYLANISTMEVQDVVEMFKMVGPMANLVSGGGKGAGLDDTFLLALMASEVGLRGGQVGRGVSQLFTSLLDPTNKMLGIMGKYFGDGEAFTTEQYKDEFFEGGALKGGIMGFFQRLADTGLKGTDMAQMVAEMFTNNATRASLGPILGLNKAEIAGMDWDEFFQGWDENPMKWLAQAAAETANSVSGWFDYMKNAWFQFQAAIIQSISGPLMGAFRMIGELLFGFAKGIKDNPFAGQLLAGIATFVATVASVGGTAIIAAGGIMILSRSLVSMGGIFLPLLHFFLAAGLTFATLIPLLIGIGLAIGIASRLWQRDVGGMRTKWESFKESLFGAELGTMFDGFLKGVGIAHAVFMSFIDGVIFGGAEAFNIFSVAIMRAFGPMLGPAIIDPLSRVNAKLTEIVQNVKDSGPTYKAGRAYLRDYVLAMRGLVEQTLFGDMSEAAETSLTRISIAFGKDFTYAREQVERFAETIRTFLVTTINAGRQIVATWRSISKEIYANLGEALNIQGLSGALGAIGNFAQGFLRGLTSSITFLLRIIEKVTEVFATIAKSMQNAAGTTLTFRGHVITLSDAFEKLGMVIGAVIGARFIVAFGPMMAIIRTLIPLVLTFSAGLAGVASKMIIVAASVAITTASWLAHLVAMGALLLVMPAYLALKAAMWVANNAETASVVADTVAKTANAAINAVLSLTLAGLIGMVSAAIIVFFGLVAAVFAVIAAIGLVIAIIGSAIFAVATVVASVMLLSTAVSDGLGAAFRGAVSFVQGFIRGIQMIAPAINLVVSAMAKVAVGVGMLFGAGDAFEALGVAAGIGAGLVVLGITLMIAGFAGLIVAIAAAAAAFVIFQIIAIGMPALIGAAIVGIVLLVIDLVRNMEERFNQIGRAWGMLVDGMQLAFGPVIDGITSGLEQVLKTFKTVYNTIANKYNSVPDLIKVGMPDTLPTFSDEDVNIGTNITEDARRSINARKLKEVTQRVKVMFEADDDSGLNLKKLLSSVGLDDDAERFALKFGIDLDTANAQDVKKVIDEMMKVPELAAELEDVNFGDLIMSKEDFEKQTKDWETYNNLIETLMKTHNYNLKDATAEANKLYSSWGLEIPTEPSEFAKNLHGAVDGVDEATQRLEDAKKKWEEAAQNWFEMDIPAFYDMAYGPLAGKDNKSLISWMSDDGFEGIMKNVPEGTAPWMNQTEFMADFAIGGGMQFAGEGVYGQNLHKLLKDSGALDTLSLQTGIPVDVLLQGIPKFEAPEKFEAVALADMTDMLGDLRLTVPAPQLEWLDTGLGVDIGMTTSGMDWAELNKYAIGQSLQNTDWNLANYLADSWGISVAEAEAYLLANNIDPNIITQDTYSRTREAVLSSAGAYNVITDEMAQWLSDATNGFTTTAIEMTEAEFMALDDATKAILTRMGYTFIVNDYIPMEAMNKARQDIGKLRKTIEDAVEQAEGTEGGTWNFKGPDLNMDGLIESWSEVTRIVDSQTGELMVVLEDLDGTQVAIPAAEYDAYMNSVNIVKEWTVQLREEMGNLQEYFNQKFEIAIELGMSIVGATGYGLGGALNMAIGGSGASGVGNALGIPDRLSVKVDINVEEASTKISESIGVPITNGAGSIHINLTTEGFSEAASAATEIKTQLDTLTATEGVQIKIDGDITPLTEKVRTYLDSMTLNAVVEIPIGANITPMTETVSTYFTSMQTSEGIKLTFTVEAYEDTTLKLDTIKTKTEKINATHTATLAVSGYDSVLVNLGTINSSLTSIAKTHTATLSVAGWAAALVALTIVRTAISAVAKTHTVTISANDRASSAIWGIFLALAMLPTQKTITITTQMNTIRNDAAGGRIGSAGGAGRKSAYFNQSGNFVGQYSGIIGRAAGGRTLPGELTLVGEQGPELVGLSTGSYVMTAHQTEKLFRESQNTGASNPFVLYSGQNNSGGTITNNQSTEVNFNGDIYFNDTASVDKFYDEFDRRVGTQLQLARRGMRPTEEYI